MTEEGRIASAVLLIIGIALFSAITASLISLLAGDQDNSHVRSRLGQLLSDREDGDLSPEAFQEQVRKLARVNSGRTEGLDVEHW